MATDSTELTFVRCPSCRSLVPAVSTRCRMCGATLDAAATDESDKEKKSGRVRQRTMSAPDSELSSTAGQVRAETSAPPSAPPTVSAAPESEPSASDDGLSDDPLGDYVSEFEEPAPVKPVPVPPKPTPTPMAARPVTPPPAPAETEIELTDGADSSGSSALSETSERPRVIVESGGRRQFGGGKPGGLSFGRPREEAKPTARPVPPPAPPKAPPAPERPVAERVTQERRVEERIELPTAREAEPRRAEPRREEPRREEPRRDEPRREDRRSAGREERVAPVERSAPPSRPMPPSPAPSREGVKRGEAVAGRLHGWLVSYADPDGRSIELREGKFFVTGSSLKESDLIITDKSISTPHALVSVDGETGLRIQDLMSDRGVFIRHGESGAYQRREEPCTVEHGDWVRFGDVEFLVCLIAHVGAR